MELRDKIFTSINKITYESKLKTVKEIEEFRLFSELLGGTYSTVNKSEHFLHRERLTKYKDEISNWTKYEITINFGDSLTDFHRDTIGNHTGIFSISGSWPHHIKQMAEEINPYLQKLNVRNITVGCLGGNPNLVNQEYRFISKEAIECLNALRQLYKTSRIIIYGLPPSYYIYQKRARAFDNDLLNWSINNRNAVYVSLVENFRGGFFSSFNWSDCGEIHFKEKEVSRFSKLLKDKMVNLCP